MFCTVGIAEEAVWCMESLRTDAQWTSCLAKAAEGGWCNEERGPPQRLRLWLKTLAKTKHLSVVTISQIECCFSAQKVGSSAGHIPCYLLHSETCICHDD